eukprot:CAMPEP_0194579796 /NCGR_PEP_ID=MMETSP0292-20121207/13767_1 /TAXON_ID=39354 /ORGANISM="Heterosigma akashiwo, Strain CCMP2393" /LENGTH=46 /DNA_ID= /DNA_START= /DNA_END= /DNA_ORIENTATION=
MSMRAAGVAGNGAAEELNAAFSLYLIAVQILSYLCLSLLYFWGIIL